MAKYSIFSRSEYFSELTRRINSAKPGDRVAVATMSFDPKEPSVSKLMKALDKSAARGVKTDFITDAYCFLCSGNMFTPGPLFWQTKLPKHMGKQHSSILNDLEAIKRDGGNYVVTNWPTRRFTPPFKGRSHIKFAVVNDYVFVGNSNLDEEDRFDLVIGWQDSATAGRLYELAQKIIKTGSISKALGSDKDREYLLSPDSRLLLDVGRPNQSLIFKEALDLIDNAQESVFFACQYFPDKPVLKHLVSAHKRGVEVKLLYNHPLNRTPGLALVHFVNKTKNRLTMPGFLFKYQLPRKSRYMHAKLLASEKAVMVGSHNFVGAGVKLGTAELALIVKDQQFGKDCIDSLMNQIS